MKDLETKCSLTISAGWRTVALTFESVVSKGKMYQMAGWNVWNGIINDLGRSVKVKKLKALIEVS